MKTIFRLIIIFLTLIQFELFSQNSSEDSFHEFVVSASYNKPLGKLSWVYKPEPGIQLGFNWVNTYADNTSNKKGLSLGFFQFKQKEDTLFYLVPPNSSGTAVFSNYLVLSAAFHIENIKTFNKLGMVFGGDAGLAFVQYSCVTKDKNFDSGEESVEGKLQLSPQIGLNYAINQNIGVSLIGQYNALISLGSTDPNSTDYNSNAGTYRQYVSIALRVGYSF